MPPPLVIFAHIPKAAGSTVKRIIRSQFTKAQVVDVNAIPWPEHARCMETLPEEVRVVMGNARYGLHRHTPRPCQYFTMLREPIDRVVSFYHYLHRCTSHPLSPPVVSGEQDLAAFAATQRDVQTKFLAGSTLPTREPSPREELDLAKQRLTEFATFGLMEQFDASILFLNRAFGWNVTSYQRRNVNPDRPSRETPPDPRAQEVLQEANRLDAELYAFARDLFAERLAAQPPDFRRDLARFQRRLRWLAQRDAIEKRVRGIFQRLGFAAK